MIPVKIEKLQNEIIKPGIEKHLVPLLHYRGHADLGKVHRYWNYLITMKEQECDTLSQGVKLFHNPKFAHLCGPEVDIRYRGIHSFISRVIHKPNVANNVDGMLDYLHYLCRKPKDRPFRLIDVSEVSRDKNHAFWRKQTGAESKGIITPKTTGSFFYPFLVHEPSKKDEGFELTKLVNAAVPKWYPADRRADICQDMVVALLMGEITKEDLKENVGSFVSKVMKMHPTKWGHMSLDAPLYEDGGRTMHDTLTIQSGY